MANHNDRIFKENFFINFLPIIERLLGLEHILSTEEITDKLQHTLEREPDFVRIVETTKKERYILHLEFQTNNDKNMLLRMGEYHSLLMRRYDLPIRHYVLYFGNSKPSMKTELPDERVFKGFQLKNLKDFKWAEFLKSDTPEEVVLGILADFEGESAGQVIEKTLMRLEELTEGGSALGKYAAQLTVLSGLRKLEEETALKVKNMAITFDLERNPFYREAREKGRMEGRMEGKMEGIEEGKLEVAKQLLASGEFTVPKIASITGLSVSTVESIAPSKSKKKK